LRRRWTRMAARGLRSICRERWRRRGGGRSSKGSGRKIEQALKEAGGSRGRAAEILQVSYKTFTTKLREYGFEWISGQVSRIQNASAQRVGFRRGGLRPGDPSTVWSSAPRSSGVTRDRRS
jgi:regulatory Fis family protein